MGHGRAKYHVRAAAGWHGTRTCKPDGGSVTVSLAPSAITLCSRSAPLWRRPAFKAAGIRMAHEEPKQRRVSLPDHSLPFPPLFPEHKIL